MLPNFREQKNEVFKNVWEDFLLSLDQPKQGKINWAGMYYHVWKWTEKTEKGFGE
jgi:hypothetical protein